MADIELRAYIADIEGMLAAEKNDEAVAHCRHVLSYFPKNLATYRLLGKGLLEQRRFSDACDIFYRVLSAAPDDFVAHLGLAIAGEEEGDLQQAIGHMELAFETQPNNSAIQTELKRLYGRRDGVAPVRIRLTRGALARLYLRGANYARAVDELRAELKEYPDRVDLQALLAQALWRDEQRVDSLDVCQTVLDKLPYCLDANAILYNIWTTSGREEEAVAHRQRLEELDPFHPCEPGVTGEESKPAADLHIPRLDYVPPTPDEVMGVPDWVHELGLGFEEQPLLADAGVSMGVPVSEAEEPVRPVGPLPFALEEEVEPVPDWLRDMVSLEDRVAMGEETEFAWEQEGELEDEEMGPGWLGDTGSFEPESLASDAAPSEDAEELSLALDHEEGELPDWLAEAVEWSRGGAEQPSMEPESVEAQDWLLQFEEQVGEQSAVSIEPASEWLQADQGDRADQVEEAVPAAGVSAIREEEGDSPPGIAVGQEFPFDWQVRDEPPTAVAEVEPAPLPEAVKGVELPEVASAEETIMANIDQETTLPGGDEDWDQPPLDSDDALAWLERLAASQGAPLAEVPSAQAGEAGGTERVEQEEPAEPAEELPDWLRGLAPAGVGMPAARVPETEDWLMQLADELPSSDDDSEMVEPPLPDWLAGEIEPGATEQRAALREPELPPWLTGALAPESKTARAGVPHPAPEQGPEIPAALLDDIGEMPEDISEAIAWLERLAARQGGPLEEVPSQAATETAEIELPPWLAAEARPDSEGARPVSPKAAVPEAAAAAESDLLDWIPEDWSEQAIEAPLPTEPIAAEMEPELPEWLRGLKPEMAAEVEEQEVPEWLQEKETPPPVEEAGRLPEWFPQAELEPIAAAEEPEWPEWLQGAVEEGAVAEEGELPEPVVAMEEGELPEWLASAADDVPTPPSAAAVIEEAELPEWLLEAAQEALVAEEAELPETAAALPEAAMPSWVQEAVEEAPLLPEGLAEAEESELPEWLRQAAEAEPVAEAAGLPEPVVAIDEEALPEWLSELAEEVPTPPSAAVAVEEQELPEWLRETAEEAPVSDEGELPEAPAAVAEAELPDWLRESPDQIPEPVEAVAAAEEPELPAWLLESAGEEPALPETVAVIEELEPPEWLLEELPEPTVAEVVVPAPAVPEIAAPVTVEEPPSGAAALRRQLALSLDDQPVRLALARALRDEDALDEALAEYDELVVDGQELDQAAIDLENLVQSLPRHPLARRILGDVYLRRGELDRALDAYRAALDQI